MAQPYLNNLQHIIEQLQPNVQRLDTVICKHFFSGAAAYLEGRLFMSLSPVGLALKLPKNSIEELFEKGAIPLQYFPKAPVKKDYAVLPVSLVENTDDLAHWVQQSINFNLD